MKYIDETGVEIVPDQFKGHELNYDEATNTMYWHWFTEVEQEAFNEQCKSNTVANNALNVAPQSRADIDYIAMMTDVELDDEIVKSNEHSAKFELVKSYYEKGLWSADRVRNAVVKGWITQAECDEILAA